MHQCFFHVLAFMILTKSNASLKHSNSHHVFKHARIIQKLLAYYQDARSYTHHMFVSGGGLELHASSAIATELLDIAAST